MQKTGRCLRTHIHDAIIFEDLNNINLMDFVSSIYSAEQIHSAAFLSYEVHIL